MAAICSNVVSAVGIGFPYLVSGVTVQYCYLFGFGSFRDTLDQEVENLTRELENVKSRVEADQNNGRTIYSHVKKWLDDASDILPEAAKLKEDMENMEGCFMGWACRYTFSKKFEEKTTKIIKLLKTARTYGEVCLPRAQFSIPYVSSNDFVPSQSSEAALDQIMECLKDESTNVIGLYGMGGVGKTTLAEQVIKLVDHAKLFENVVMVLVSHTPDLMAIQDNVAADLGFEFKNEKDVRTKAGALKLRMEKEKKILIILDDIWNSIDLPGIGIAFTAEQKSCKLLITTRNRNMCSRMTCNKEIRIDVMGETEAWDLFKTRAALNDTSPIIDTAKEVAKECGGLPVAIVSLARALVGSTPSQWKAALLHLQNYNLLGITHLEDENAYKCLKMSYDQLNGEIKLCFLMCPLFPEDHEIEIEVLVRYAWGLGVCQGADTIENARTMVQSYIDDLKDYCLLIIDSRTNKVKMHDVVRHFALWIAFKEEKDFTVGYISRLSIIRESLERFMAISLIIKGTQQLQSGLLCRNMELLLLCEEGARSVSDTFFNQMEALQVLTIRNCDLQPYLPDNSISLRVLCIEGCKVGDISSLGNLKKLEILRFCHSDIRELPDDIGEMKDLKVLDLSSCIDLERIPAGLIQKLSCLEELYVTGSERKPWEVRGGDSGSSGKARLSELNSLSELKVLSLDNIGGCLLPDYFVLPNLTRYHITESLDWLYLRKFPVSQILEINKINETSLNAYKIFFSTVEELVSVVNEEIRCIVPDMELEVFNNLTSLYLSRWKKMVCLIDTTVENVPTMAFGNLKKLTLLEMHSLKELCVGQVSNEFLQKLERVTIQKCAKLCSIFQVQPEEIRNEDSLMLFSTLKELILESLPELSCVWEGPTGHINLNCLTYVRIFGCRKLKSIFSLSMARTLVHLQRLDIQYCNELEHIIEEEEENGLQPSTIISNLIFTRLETVKIENCNKLKCIFPIFVAPSCLQQLKEIILRGNVALEQIFKYAEGNHMEIELSHLQSLSIYGSPNLVNFSGGHCSALSFPSLQKLGLDDCAIQFPLRLRLQGRQLEKVLLQEVPKEWGNYILSLLNIGDLPNLNLLGIGSLIGVEEVIRLEVDNHISDLVLPIQTLILANLPELAHICNCPSYTSILQNLTDLKIYGCHKLSYILSPALAQNLPMLETLKIKDCKELVQVIGNADEGVPNNLKLEGFPSLKKIRIKKCNKIKFVLPLSVVGGLPNLQKLDVQKCDVVYVFGNETLHAGNDIVEKEEVVLPKLKNIVLKELPSLIGFSLAGYNIICPLIMSDYQLNIGGCPNITESFTLSATTGTTIRKENSSTAEDGSSTSSPIDI